MRGLSADSRVTRPSPYIFATAKFTVCLGNAILRAMSRCVNPATFPLDPSGTNAVPASSFSARFFRLKAAER